MFIIDLRGDQRSCWMEYKYKSHYDSNLVRLSSDSALNKIFVDAMNIHRSVYV